MTRRYRRTVPWLVALTGALALAVATAFAVAAPAGAGDIPRPTSSVGPVPQITADLETHCWQNPFVCPYRVRISQAYPAPIVVSASTRDGSATSPDDYLGFTDRRIVITAGKTEGEITLSLGGRATTDARFQVLLTGASAGTITQAVTVVIIHADG
jgi:hypothetical protein